jgi:two-component system nitrogen regulation sensor histidine kinase GlnL
MIWYKLSLLFGFGLTTCIGIAVLVSHPRRRLNQYWALLCLSVALWNFGRFMRLLEAAQQQYDEGLFWCRVMYIGAIMIPVFFYFFVCELLKIRSRFGLLAFAPAVLFLAVTFTPLLVKGIELKFNRIYYPVPGILYPVFFIYFLIYVLVSHYHLYRSYRTSSGRMRSQIRYVGSASIIGFISGLTTFPLVFNIKIPPIGAPLVSLYTLVIAYAIIKYRLMDIHIILKKTLTYSLLILLIIIPCYLLIMSTMKNFLGVENPGIWFSVLVLSVLMFVAFFVPRVKTKTEKSIEQTIFSGRYDYLQTLKKSSQDMVTILHLPDLLERLLDTLNNTFDISRSSVLLFDLKKKSYTLACARNRECTELETVEYPEHDAVFDWLTEHKEILILEELENSPRRSAYTEIIGTLHALESQVCIPLLFQKRLIGIINLGSRLSGEMFTNEELKILSTVANQAAIAIENAQIYTKMLRTDRLAAVGTLAARLAHEIRNPLVSIKTVTDLLPERIDDPEFREHFLGIAIQEIQRMKKLIDDLLDFAKPSVPQFRYEDINQLIKDMLRLVEGESRSKGVLLSSDLEENVPRIMADQDQVKQVFLNLLLNAIQACDSNGKIDVITKSIDKGNAKNYVQVAIRDNGAGIHEKDLDNLFNPFFTTKHEGIGLGLSIAHQIVQEHKGSIEVDSKINVGTTFYVNFLAQSNNGKDSAV